MNVRIIFLTFTILLLVSSCCTKKGCIGIENLNTIYFYNFQESELDGLKLYTYSNSSYSVILDSTQIGQSLVTPDYMYVDIYPNLIEGGFYKVKLSDNTTFTIDNFKSKKQRCNTGFMCRDFFQVLKSYRINGIEQEGFAIEIYK